MDINNLIFHSTTKAVPALRGDLRIIPVDDDGRDLLYFQDQRGYVAEGCALQRAVAPLLQRLDGRHTLAELQQAMSGGPATEELLEFVQFLDKQRLLQSPYFEAFAEQKEQAYEQSSVHKSVTAGGSYPASPDEVRTYLDDAFADHRPAQRTTISGSLRALYAPHIDPRVGIKSYVEAFAPLKKLTPQRVVILATSHYSGWYPEHYDDHPFVLSRKSFAMPLQTIEADTAAVDRLMQQAPQNGCTDHDRAHRIEHSIELHLLFLNYLWNHHYQIVPVVVGSLDEVMYVPDGHRAQQVAVFAQQLRQLADEDTFFLISGDLAHTGKKFGDEQPANAFKSDVREFDERFLEAAAHASPRQLLTVMQQNHDAFRICGYPPLYTFLRAFPNLHGTRLSYQRWDEAERQSAVTFGSVAFSE